MSHHFISYSTAEAQEFAIQLHDRLESGHPKIEAWLDKRDLQAGVDWDSQIAEGIRDCDSLLFVMTPDSVTDTSVCKLEWSLALKYKKPIVLLMRQACDPPFRLQNRQYIDFSSNFEDGIAKLHSHIEWLASPAGELQRLRNQLADAERDLRRAKDDVETARIQEEMSDLKKTIAWQEEIATNPENAALNMQQSILSRLEDERQPEKPVSAEQKIRFVNPPPGITPDYFQDRTVESKMVADFLRSDGQRLITVVGRGGIGKTAMICRLLKGLENRKLPDDLPPMPIDGIVYLSEIGTRRAKLENLFSDLGKLLAAETAAALEGIYKNPQATTESKVRDLLEAFPSGRTVLLLDNFEDALDENRKIKDAELDEALKTILNAPHHAIKVVITSRVAPRDLLLIQPQRQQTLALDEGVGSPYAEKILRGMDRDGKLGLKNAADEKLRIAQEKTRGFPRALEAIVAILRADRYTTLDDLLANPLPENVTDALVGQAFNRLDMAAQKVMQALAAYGRPVPEVAVDYLLQLYFPGMNSTSVMARLVNMHFARREGGRFYLHPVDRQYALSLIPKGEASDRAESDSPPFTQIALFTRGAEYFASTRKPKEDCKALEDLRPQLDEFDLRCEAGDFDGAAGVLMTIDYSCLILWGYYLLSIQLHNRLLGKIKDATVERGSVGDMGIAYAFSSKIDEAIVHFEHALKLSRQQKYRKGEATWTNWLGNCYISIGKVNDAVPYYHASLEIALELNNRHEAAYALGSLGNAYKALAQMHQAIDHYEQALAIFREVGDRRSAGICLGSLGNIYSPLGQLEQAIEVYEQALTIARDLGDRRHISAWLLNIGIRYVELGQVERGIGCYEEVLAICRETKEPLGEATTLGVMGQALADQEKWDAAHDAYQQSIRVADSISLIGVQNGARAGQALAYLYTNDLAAARAAIESAAAYDVPENNHNVFAALGVIALRQGDSDAAHAAFAEAVTKADRVLAQTPQLFDALDAKGLALCGLALSVGAHRRAPLQSPESYIEDAKSAFRAARKITTAKGIVGRTLRLLDALTLVDTAGVLVGVRDVVAGD